MNSRKLRVLLCEDDPLTQEIFLDLLKATEFSLHKSGADFVKSEDFRKKWDLILLDLTHADDPGGASSVALIPEIRHRHKGAELVIQSGLSDVAVMRGCIQQGASRFVLKEHLAAELPLLLERISEFQKHLEILDEVIVGESEIMKALKQELFSLRFETSADVLIEGETGTGKELCARALQNQGPFVSVNVSAIAPELFEAEFFGSEKGAFTGSVQARVGHFEAAGSGVLFLDEIQSLSAAHQAKILRVLETRTFLRVGSSVERPFKARIVSASNQSLREAVSRGRFREDLWYRLSPFCIRVPPLRVRGDDIEILARNFLRRFDEKKRMSFTKAGLNYLCTSHDWPGNVRELKGLLQNLALKSPMPVLDEPELREALQKPESLSNESLNVNVGALESDFEIDWSLGLDELVAQLEKQVIEKTLNQLKSTEAREKLGLTRSRFYEKVKQYGLLR